MKKNKCPHCGKAAEWQNNPWRPFCSKRCRLIDLGDWAAEKYRVAGEQVKNEDNNQDTRNNNQDTIIKQ